MKNGVIPPNDSDSLRILLKSVAEDLGEDGMHWNRHLDILKVFTSLVLPLGATVLDVGCGLGHLCLAIKRLGHNVYAVDINLEKFGDRWRKHNTSVTRCDIEKESLPFINETFDCVICTEVIEHLDPRSLHHILSEIFRSLKEGGILLLTTPNLASFQNRIRLLLGRRVIISNDHVREYVVEELLEPLEKVGFSTFYTYLLAFDKLAVIKGRSDVRISVARALLYPLKLAVRRFRSLVLILAYKNESL